MSQEQPFIDNQNALYTAEDRVRRLERALSFAASCIKSGEPWSVTCEEIIGGALRDD